VAGPHRALRALTNRALIDKTPIDGTLINSTLIDCALLTTASDTPSQRNRLKTNFQLSVKHSKTIKKVTT
jgi:hypothetical protein